MSLFVSFSVDGGEVTLASPGLSMLPVIPPSANDDTQISILENVPATKLKHIRCLARPAAIMWDYVPGCWLLNKYASAKKKIIISGSRRGWVISQQWTLCEAAACLDEILHHSNGGQLKPLFSEFLLRLRQYPLLLLLLLLTPITLPSSHSTPSFIFWRFWFWFFWRFSKSWRTSDPVLQLFENLQKTLQKNQKPIAIDFLVLVLVFCQVFW